MSMNEQNINISRYKDCTMISEYWS